MLVQLAFGPGLARHDVLGGELDGGADREHGVTRTRARRGSVQTCPRRWPGRPPAHPRTRTCGSPALRAATRAAGRPRHGRRRPRSQRFAKRAGIVDTCVLRIVNRRRWKRPPSGSTAGWVPYQEATSNMPSWASNSKAPGSAAGLPDASTTRLTPLGTAGGGEGLRRVVRRRRARRRAPRPAPVATTAARLTRTRAPARCSSAAVNSPMAPAPTTTTVSSSDGAGIERDLQRRLDERQHRRRPWDRCRPARRHRHRRRRSGPGAGGTRTRARRRDVPRLRPPPTRRCCSRTETGYRNVPASAPIVSSRSIAGSSWPR